MRILIAILFMGVCTKALAAGETGFRKVSLVGCHINEPVCFVQIDGPAVGPSACSGNSIRFDPTASATGQSVLSLIYAAHFSGKTLNFYMSDACFTRQAGFPTFYYVQVAS